MRPKMEPVMNRIGLGLDTLPKDLGERLEALPEGSSSDAIWEMVEPAITEWRAYTWQNIDSMNRWLYLFIGLSLAAPLTHFLGVWGLAIELVLKLGALYAICRFVLCIINSGRALWYRMGVSDTFQLMDKAGDRMKAEKAAAGTAAQA